jgi:hypothetical protein
MLTPGYARYLVVSFAALAGIHAAVPWGWFEGS